MRSDGSDEILAHWREAGAWWADEGGTEVVRAVRNGRFVEECRPLPPLVLPSRRAEYEENHREDYVLRERKTRDEKVAAENGELPERYYVERSRERQVTSRPLARRP